MTPFAFVIHPLNARQLARKYPIAKFLSDGMIENLSKFKKPEIVSHITGIESITGAKTEGWFVGLPLTPRQMTQTLPIDFVYHRIIQCAEAGAREGAKIIGLGAFTSVVGDGGITVAKSSPIAVTTGNSYTVATAIEGTLKACNMLNLDLANCTLAVVGATGSIGKTCAQVLSRDFGRTILIGRDLERTQAIAKGIPGAIVSTDISSILEADAVVTVTSSDAEVVLPEHLKPGAVVCDVARPRDVSVRVAKERPDVLVIEGGVVTVPGSDVDFHFDFGFPKRTAYACMSETIMLALDDRPECFTLGKDVTVEQVDETQRLAAKHGFSLSGFRSFEREVDEASIQRARNARLMAGTVVRS